MSTPSISPLSRLIRGWSQSEDPAEQSIWRSIAYYLANPPRIDEIQNSLSTACQAIVGGLYLGNSTAFAEATHFRYEITQSDGSRRRLETSNPNRFDEIITMCPVAAIEGDYPSAENRTSRIFFEHFQQHHIQWHYFGKNLIDDPRYWLELVHDCTFPDSELSSHEYPIANDRHYYIALEKSELIDRLPVNEWFKHAFAILDKAVRGEKRILVHCQLGKSRSATLLAAYFIKRYKLTADEAITFLKAHRHGVDSLFIEHLTVYARALNWPSH